MAKKENMSVKLDAIRHKDKRTNIPTEELRDFVSDDELSPKVMLYPRDSALDPQLVWKGKDELDHVDLCVPVVPIYIQEKIHPQAIINDLAAHAATSMQLELFDDFNGGPHDFDQKVDFYHHQQNWSNRLILGDSLLVMTSLAEKEALKGNVQCIYMDPPYGIKFGSNWQVSTRKREVKDGKVEDASRQPEQVQAFRDTWELGVHSYLTYLRDRLKVASELLTETGSVFVQIGEENVHLVRSILDEVFGSENYIAQITFQKTGGLVKQGIIRTVDYLLWYAKNSEVVKVRPLYLERRAGDTALDRYDLAHLADGSFRRLTKEEFITGILPEGARRCRQVALESANPTFPFSWKGKTYVQRWKTTEAGLTKLGYAGRLAATTNRLNSIRYVDDFPVIPLTDRWESMQIGTELFYVVQTATSTIQNCVLMTTDPGDIVLDPTCGSGTTAYVAEQWGRRWITCDTSRVALALARTRLMSAKYPYYLLADSPEGVKKEAELSGKKSVSHETDNDIRKGFVYKRVPHITMKSIANNPDIREGMSQKEIDTVILRSAETETLFDQPYEDSKRTRVTGPFSVESLSPHRVLSTADLNMDGTVSEQEAQKQKDFASMILENLQKAGVENTRKGERMNFERIDYYAGKWVHAVGEYNDGEGNSRRVAISIGPEHGTVGPEHVKEAAKEAVQGVGFETLLVCGFAFDPHVAEEVKRYGKLTVLPTKMNPDLAMGDDLLKKTGGANLFMVFGEPDVEIAVNKEGNIVVEIKGVDVYDPTTGEIRSATTNDIACWFIDTDYNGESFFVRQAYFTGGVEPYQKLKRALRSEIDESAWNSLYTTKSRSFERPKSGKIAVKVINHYGDEVLKVFSV